MSKHSEEVALLAIASVDPAVATPDWRRMVRHQFRDRHPECGSILLMILIPIIVNLVTAWLAKWIFKEHPTSLDGMRMEAITALKS
jgi:hypothetical protein